MEGKRYTNSSQDGQEDYFKNFAKHIGKVAEDDFKEESIGFLIRADSFLLTSDEFQAMALMDALFSILAVTFVFIYLNIHL